MEPGASVIGGGGYLQRHDIEGIVGSSVADAADDCTGETGEIALFGIDSDVQVR